MRVKRSVAVIAAVGGVGVALLAMLGGERLTGSDAGRDRQPHIAANGPLAALVYGRGDAVGVRVSRDGGRTFAPAGWIPAGGRMALGMRRGPRVAVTSAAIVVTAVAGPLGGGRDGDVWMWRSEDAGRSWSTPARLNSVTNAAREGLHAVAASADGILLAAWLDLRDKGTTIRVAASSDHGRSWSPDGLAYRSPGGSVCECCHPTAAVAPGGRLAVLFRNNLDGARDMYVAEASASAGPWTHRKLGTGTWPLSACPMDGGDLTIDARGQTHAVWRREDEVFYTTGDGGERRLAQGRNAVVAVAADKPEPLFVWSGSNGGLTIRRGVDGRDEILDARGAFASAAAVPGGMLIAWETPNGVATRLLP